MEPIREFRGSWRFLSNFSPASVSIGGHVFPTVEHAFVFSKTLIPGEQEQVLQAREQSPGFAKRLGHTLTLRPDWQEVKVFIMLELLRQKFSDGHLRSLLLSTEDRELIEGNSWGDTFWGVDLHTGKGQNTLGRLLMKVRDELRSRYG